MNKRTIALLGIGLFAAAAPLLASEASPAQNRTEIVRSELTSEQEVTSQREYTATASEELRETSEISMYSVVDLDKSYPLMQQCLTIVNNTIEMSDGSVWQIDPSDAHRMEWWQWTAGSDLLVITQNTSLWGSKYQFRIHNITKSDYLGVACNILLAPFLERTAQIADIDDYGRKIYLTDGSIWSISSEDDYIYFNRPGGASQRRWIPGDQLIIGVNDGFWSYSRPYILINVTVDGKFVKADLIR
jgi:hypothetical protein